MVNYLSQTLRCHDQRYRYRQPENAFTQPNARVNEQMIAWAQTQAIPLSGGLLELYCGIGNFTLPLAREFDHVIATELSKTATAAAEHNRRSAGIKNIEFEASTVRAIADRRTGVGCDQLIVMEPAHSREADLFIRIYNSDGSEVDACGNATRCIAAQVMDENATTR